MLVDPRPDDFWGTFQGYEPTGLQKYHREGSSKQVHKGEFTSFSL